MGGTLAVVDALGEILWDANLSGTLPHTPTIGDVDGDGQVGRKKPLEFYYSTVGNTIYSCTVIQLLVLCYHV